MRNNKDLIFKRNCPVCEKDTSHQILYFTAKDYEYGIKADKYRIVACKECNLVSLDPVPSSKELLLYYPWDYCNYCEENKNILSLFMERLYSDMQVNLVRRLIGECGTILDVGCSTGNLIGLLQQRGNWVCEGVEFKDEVAQAGRAKGRKIFTGTLESCRLTSDKYDLVILNHMIEHVSCLVGFIKEVFRILKKEGKVFIETPNSSSLDFKLFGEKWGCVHYPRHTYLFSAENIKKLLHDSGFKIQEVAFSNHTCGWALGCQNALTNIFGLKKKYGRIKLYPILLLVFLPFTLLQQAAGNASIMRVVGVKP